MSKELNTQEQSIAVVEVKFDQVTVLDEMSLALVSGGEYPVAL